MSESHPRNCVSKPGRTSFRAGITADWRFQETLILWQAPHSRGSVKPQIWDLRLASFLQSAGAAHYRGGRFVPKGVCTELTKYDCPLDCLQT
jgi:hypothetical protein